MKDKKQKDACDTSPKTSGGGSGAREGEPPSPTGGQPVKPVKAGKSYGAAPRSTQPATDSLAAGLAKARDQVFGMGEPLAEYCQKFLAEHPDEPPDESFVLALSLALKTYGLGERIGQVECKVVALECKMAEQRARISGSENRDA